MTETVRIILGYVSVLGYMGLVMLFGEILNRKCGVSKDMVRKIEHVMTAPCWVAIYFIIGRNINFIIINIIIFITLTVAALTGFLGAVERDDAKKSYGLIHYGLGTLLVAIASGLKPDLLILTGIPFYAVALGDGFAPIFAKLAGDKNVKITEDKSLVGMLTVFFFSAGAAVVYNYAFGLNFSWLFMISVGALATILEFFGRKGLDNLLLELVIYAYLLLNHFGMVTPELSIALILSPIFTALSVKMGSLTVNANIVAFIYYSLSAFFVGAPLFAVILLLYVLAAISSKITGKIFYKNRERGEKSARGAFQIFANSIVSLAFAALYYFLRDPIFIVCSLAAIAEEFADTMASDVGRLSKNQPIDILRFKRTEAGISGGVSLLGSAFALVGALIAASAPFMFMEFNLGYFLLIVAVGFFGTFVDSILGSSAQALYECSVCGKALEAKTHCDAPAKLVRGLGFVTNSAVNLISGAVAGGVAFLILFLLK